MNSERSWWPMLESMFLHVLPEKIFSESSWNIVFSSAAGDSLSAHSIAGGSPNKQSILRNTLQRNQPHSLMTHLNLLCVGLWVYWDVNLSLSFPLPPVSHSGSIVAAHFTFCWHWWPESHALAMAPLQRFSESRGRGWLWPGGRRGWGRPTTSHGDQLTTGSSAEDGWWAPTFEYFHENIIILTLSSFISFEWSTDLWPYFLAVTI